MKLLEKSLGEQDSVIWLEGLGGPFLALYEEDIGTDPEGAVLILHAEGQHTNWPTTIERIRSTLPYHGWITLATSLPNPAETEKPKRTLPANPVPTTQPPLTDATGSSNAAQNTPAPGESTADQTPAEQTQADPATTEPRAEAGEENEIFDDTTGALSDGNLQTESASSNEEPVPPQLNPEDIAHSRIEAAIRHLNDQGIFNIVLLGDGVGAARAGHYLGSLPEPKPKKRGEKPIKPIRAMIIINARNTSPRGDINLLSSLYDSELPTLDIYFGTHQQDNRDSIERKKYALRNGFKTYQQILLPELSHNTMLGENRLSKRVRGFLSKYAKGVKVENAIVNRRQ
ncbi:MAG: DUF3530 family protein [Candidatus Pelagadaptatus aseana]